MVTIERNAYCAVRKNNDGHWLDLNSIGIVPEEVEKNITETHRVIPAWAKEHPARQIIRIAIKGELSI